MVVPADSAWEVVVIDNNSTDKTSEMVGGFLTRGTLPLKYIFEPISGVSTARNRGIRESKGELLAFLDDDVMVSRQWLIEVRNAFQQYDAACVSGRVLLHEACPRPAWWHKSYDLAVGEFDRGTQVIVDESVVLFGIAANIIFKRTVFDRVGWFRTDLGRKKRQQATGEETEVVERLRQQKQRLVYYPDALVYHCIPPQRFSKRYLRRHFYHLGQHYCLTEWDNPKLNHRILGVPLWQYRVVLTHLWRALLFLLTGRLTEFFFEHFEVLIFVGYFRAAQRVRRAKRSGLVWRLTCQLRQLVGLAVNRNA